MKEKVYTIEQEFKDVKNKTVLKTILASINDEPECEKVFIENRPHIVFPLPPNTYQFKNYILGTRLRPT